MLTSEFNGLLKDNKILGSCKRINFECKDFSTKEGYDAAERCALNIISQAKKYLENDLSKINIINPNLIISNEEVDKSIENLRSSYTIWSPSEKKAKKGDRLKVNFKGKVNNEDFPNNEAKDFHVILGSNQLIPGFEDGLVGASKGEKLDLKVKFPDDYHEDNLKGKNAVFDTEVLEVENGDKPKIDKEFLKNFGIEDGTKKDLEKKIEDGMRLDCENIIENYVKKQAIEELVSKNKFKIPSSLVEDEQKRTFNCA